MRYALVLGGGGARGAFEAGVWSKLCEMNKEIEAVAGTSVGAVNGAVFLSGICDEEMWRDIRAEDILPGIKEENILSPISLMGHAGQLINGGVDIEPLKSLISRFVSEEKIRRSAVEFGICLYSVKEKRIKQLFKEDMPDGTMIDHITAAASFPVFKNHVVEDEELTDGGMFNNLPADMLIKRGYKNIISVSAGGPGYEKSYSGRGVNIISIKYKNPEQGVLEFKSDAAERSIKLGKLECGRVFGEYCGERFFIDSGSYYRAMKIYGEEIIKGIEKAAEISGVERLCEYSFSELVEAVMKGFMENKQLREEVRRIERCPRQLINSKKNDIFYAANTVLYMKSCG